MALIIVGQTAYLALFPVTARVVQRRTATRPALPPAKTRQDRRPSDAPETNNDSKSANQRYTLVNDPRLLYAPPTPADQTVGPLSLDWFPPGATIFTVMRPSILWGEKRRPITAAVLGNEAVKSLEEMIELSGFPAGQLTQLVAGAYPAGGNVKFLYRAVATINLDSPPETWSDPLDAGSTESSIEIIQYRLSTNDQIRIARIGANEFLFGPNELVAGAIAKGGASASLPPPTDRISKRIRGDVDLAIFGGPNFFFSEGRRWLGDLIPNWQDNLRSFFVPDVAAFAIAVHLTDADVFVETQMLPAGLETPVQLHQRTREILSRLPDIATKQTAIIADDAPWSKLTNAYPAMMSYVLDDLRTGVSDGIVTANAYLPTVAATQWSVAAVLVANAPPKSTGTEIVAAVPKTIDEFLAMKMDVAIAQESLKAALETVRGQVVGSLPADADVPAFEIIGGDLQIDGITQNQQIRNFNQSGQSLADILTALCLSANTDKTASGPSDEKQKLVWVTHEGKILITTRAASAAKNYELPAAFVLQK